MKNINTLLEKKFVTYSNLLTIKIEDNEEAFVIVDERYIPNGYKKNFREMKSILGDTIAIRESVYKKLLAAQKDLQTQYPTYSLFVTFGYRSLEVQKTNFLKRIKIEAKKYYEDPIELYEAAHRSVAVPSVAGHPTGGAIDIIIVDKETNTSIDFGAKQYDYTNKKYYVFTPNISSVAKKNRLLLRSILLKQGFAPFDGEWWHFSYGDREWAYYYKKEKAFYTQISSDKIKKICR